MIRTPTKTTTGENFSSGAELRNDARVVVSEQGTYRVQMIFSHQKIHAECVDYSPFGLGLRVDSQTDLPLLSIGEPVDLECDFLGSRFSARGVIANTRIETTDAGPCVRIGIALSRSAEVVRPSHVKRRTARIQINESVAPLVSMSDELRFGDTIYAKMTDISHGGMRLLVDRSPLPFMEKQRYWFDILLPFFGVCRAYCRIAYVFRSSDSNKYQVGCEFVDGGGDEDLHALRDWLFYAHSWLTKQDIVAAGFSLSHLSPADERHRVTILGASDWDSGHSVPTGTESDVSRADDSQSLEFEVMNGSNALKVGAEFSIVRSELVFRSLTDVDTRQKTDVFTAFWKAVLVFTLCNRIASIQVNTEILDKFVFRETLSLTLHQQEAGFTVEDVVAGNCLKLAVWRNLIRDLQKRSEFKLSLPKSLLRRLVLLV
jgi:hypothetical protein